jgi:hypothetical protein
MAGCKTVVEVPFGDQPLGQSPGGFFVKLWQQPYVETVTEVNRNGLCLGATYPLPVAVDLAD